MENTSSFKIIIITFDSVEMQVSSVAVVYLCGYNYTFSGITAWLRVY